jgi:small-conductance mechanosensitive channel
MHKRSFSGDAEDEVILPKYTALADSLFQVSKILISVVLIFLGLGSFGIISALALGSLIAVSVGLWLVRKLLPANPLKK